MKIPISLFKTLLKRNAARMPIEDFHDWLAGCRYVMDGDEVVGVEWRTA